MTDKELLELAAKADGRKTERIAGKLWIEKCTTEWNPLTDDGDALRLAVKLGLSIDPTENLMVAEFDGFGEYEKATDVWFVDSKTAQTFSAMEIHGNDSCAATRRAIVRAAAEIGRAIP
jgi:hypothetical protein